MRVRACARIGRGPGEGRKFDGGRRRRKADLPLITSLLEPETSDSCPTGRTQKPREKSPPLLARSAVKFWTCSRGGSNRRE
jgi:hypothetical protein